VDLRETPSSLALDRTASSVRPSLSPIARVGVFSRANFLSLSSPAPLQDFPLFLSYLANIYLLTPVYPAMEHLAATPHVPVCMIVEGALGIILC